MTANDRIALILGRLMIQNEGLTDELDRAKRELAALQAKTSKAVKAKDAKVDVPPVADARNGIEVVTN